MNDEWHQEGTLFLTSLQKQQTMKARASAADLCDVMLASVGFFGLSGLFESSANDLCSASDSMQAHLSVVDDEKKPLPPFVEVFGSSLKSHGLLFTEGMYRLPSFSEPTVEAQQNGASGGVLVQQNGASGGVLVQQNGASGGVLADASQASSGLSSCEVPCVLLEVPPEADDQLEQFQLFQAQLGEIGKWNARDLIMIDRSCVCRYCGHSTQTMPGVLKHLRKSCYYRHRKFWGAPLVYQCPVCGEWLPDLLFGALHLGAHFPCIPPKGDQCFLCPTRGLAFLDWVQHLFVEHKYPLESQPVN